MYTGSGSGSESGKGSKYDFVGGLCGGSKVSICIGIGSGLGSSIGSVNCMVYPSSL